MVSYFFRCNFIILLHCPCYVFGHKKEMFNLNFDRYVQRVTHIFCMAKDCIFTRFVDMNNALCPIYIFIRFAESDTDNDYITCMV